MRRSKALLLTTMIAAASITGCQSTMNQADNQSKQKATQAVANQVQQINAADLQRYNWTLVQATDARNQPLQALNDINNQVVLKFAQQNNNQVLSFSVVCN